MTDVFVAPKASPMYTNSLKEKGHVLHTEITADNAAKILGMYPRKGAIAPWAKSSSPYYIQTLDALAKHLGISGVEVPVSTSKASAIACQMGRRERSMRPPSPRSRRQCRRRFCAFASPCARIST